MAALAPVAGLCAGPQALLCAAAAVAVCVVFCDDLLGPAIQGIPPLPPLPGFDTGAAPPLPDVTPPGPQPDFSPNPPTADPPLEDGPPVETFPKGDDFCLAPPFFDAHKLGARIIRDGRTIAEREFESGYTPFSYDLRDHLGKQRAAEQASHTEAKATRWALQQGIGPGDTLDMDSLNEPQLPPCTHCRGYMNRLKQQTGADSVYRPGVKGKSSWTTRNLP